jgi:hypothetical protein
MRYDEPGKHIEKEHRCQGPDGFQNLVNTVKGFKVEVQTWLRPNHQAI